MNESLNLGVFTNVGEDFEKRQYLILGKLKAIKEAFQHNQLYPHLSELIELQRQLKKLLDEFSLIKNHAPKNIKSVDLINKRIEYESALPDQLDMKAVEDLGRWALPKIKEVIEEGATIFEFIQQNLIIENVGIEPSYLLEGYAMVPDTLKGTMHIYRYEVSIFTSSEERYRSLKTKHVKTFSGAVQIPLSTIKLELIQEFKDLPNPATYAIQTDLELPFEASLLPISRRKLLQRIAA